MAAERRMVAGKKDAGRTRSVAGDVDTKRNRDRLARQRPRAVVRAAAKGHKDTQRPKKDAGDAPAGQIPKRVQAIDSRTSGTWSVASLFPRVPREPARSAGRPPRRASDGIPRGPFGQRFRLVFPSLDHAATAGFARGLPQYTIDGNADNESRSPRRTANCALRLPGTYPLTCGNGTDTRTLPSFLGLHGQALIVSNKTSRTYNGNANLRTNGQFC